MKKILLTGLLAFFAQDHCNAMKKMEIGEFKRILEEKQPIGALSDECLDQMSKEQVDLMFDIESGKADRSIVTLSNDILRDALASYASPPTTPITNSRDVSPQPSSSNVLSLRDGTGRHLRVGKAEDKGDCLLLALGTTREAFSKILIECLDCKHSDKAFSFVSSNIHYQIAFIISPPIEGAEKDEDFKRWVIKKGQNAVRSFLEQFIGLRTPEFVQLQDLEKFQRHDGSTFTNYLNISTSEKKLGIGNILATCLGKTLKIVTPNGSIYCEFEPAAVPGIPFLVTSFGTSSEIFVVWDGVNHFNPAELVK
ncbi:hypothetical protein FACS1894122_12690 [Alphaproteobacteria bacterium]|nr:hypothetical protein FACS1894122_12690 [Alphaproteobacteria bacterium]